ncbi:MAG: biopolymer transporter ExbD [Lentisphaerota bacterium]
MSNRYSESFKSRLKPLSGRPDLTPMLAVLFLLLIFFMLSSSFVQVSGIKVDLPEIGTKGTLGVEKFVITVTMTESGSEIYFNEKVVSWESLKQELANVSNYSTSATVILRADQKTPFGTISKIMSIAEKANLSVFIATVPPKKKQETTFEQNE